MLPNLAQVKAFILSEFPDLLPDGHEKRWSFFYKEVRTGPNSHRIARAKQKEPGRKIDFKLSVSKQKLEITPDWENQVRKEIEREIQRWEEKHSGK